MPTHKRGTTSTSFYPKKTKHRDNQRNKLQTKAPVTIPETRLLDPVVHELPPEKPKASWLSSVKQWLLGSEEEVGVSKDGAYTDHTGNKYYVYSSAVATQDTFDAEVAQPCGLKPLKISPHPCPKDGVNIKDIQECNKHSGGGGVLKTPEENSHIFAVYCPSEQPFPRNTTTCIETKMEVMCRSTPENATGGYIALGVIGGLAVAGAVGALIYNCRKKRQNDSYSSIRAAAAQRTAYGTQAPAAAQSASSYSLQIEDGATAKKGLRLQ